ncbi:unnamed protein product [Ophioblennius macclurei]
MGTQGTGRKRSTKKDRSTAEDDALNLIAREAEARLAAKRAARAEAREIRMKELERQQKELSDEDERMSVGSRGSVRVDDRDYLEKGSRAASALTAATLTSLGGSSSRRGSGETALTVDAETSIREIKDALAQSEEKYRKAMVSNAQLDNEKNNLMYQVDTLKDSLMELEELLSESRRAHEEKVKDYEREKHAHGVLQFQFNEMKETLKQSEELLNDIRQLRMKQEGFVREISDLQETVEWKDKKIGALERQKEYTDAIRIERDELREEVVKLKDILKKHGIVLSPDLNINGDVGETESDGTPAANPTSPPAQEPLTSPTEGNSMLGNTEETEFRSSRKEDVDPEQQQEILEESKENLLNSDACCDGAGVSILETSDENHPPKTDLPLEEGSIGEDGICKDLIVEPTVGSKAIIVSGSELQDNVTNPEKSLPEAIVFDERGLNKTRYPDSEETEIKSSAETHDSDFTDKSNSLSEKQDKKFQGADETDSIGSEASHRQTVACVMAEGPSEESVTVLSNTEPQQEPENAEEAENDAAEETPTNSNKGKKRKKKKKGKKKGTTQNDTQNQQTSGTEKESGKTAKQVESGEMNNGCVVELQADTLANEDFKESSANPVKNEQDMQQDGSTEPVEAPESSSQEKSLKETKSECEKEQKQEETKTSEEVEATHPPETLIDTTVHNMADEQEKDQTQETHVAESVEAVALAINYPHAETYTELSTDSKKVEEEDEVDGEADKLETVASVELKASLCAYDMNSKSGDSLEKEDPCVDNTDNAGPVSTDTNFINTDSKTADQVIDKSECVEETTTECTTKNDLEKCSEESSKQESFVSNGGDVSALQSETMNVSSPSTTDAFGWSSESEPFAAVKSDVEPSIDVLEQNPEEGTEAVTINDSPGAGAETEEESAAASPGQDSELVPEEAEREEVDERVTEPGMSDKPHSSSSDENSDSCHSAPGTSQGPTVHTEPVEQNEQLEESEGETPQQVDQAEETVDVKREEDHTSESQEEANETETETSIKQETADGDEPERENDRHDDVEELCESAQATSENIEPSPATRLDSDEEDEEDEGQSFDFDDLDVEAAVATDLPHNPEEEEFEEGVEATSESSDERSGLCESVSQPDGNTQDKLVETPAESGTLVVSEEADPEPQENRNPSAHGESEKEEKEVQEEEPGVAEEKKSELGAVVENIKQKVSSLVEEAFDVVTLDWQNEASASTKSSDQVTESKEPAQGGRSVRKGSKKGKGKGKEDCKVA